MVKGIDKLTICGPYDKPGMHYSYDSGRDLYHKTPGRRPSGYRSMSEDGRYGMHKEIGSVNRIRPRVDEWREGGYPGSTETTRKLLAHWRHRDEPRLFFCQIEAMETIIYSFENPGVVDRLMEGDGSPFRRYCTKMATGTGKTVVMGMLIAWQALNSGSGYTKDVLVVTPNLTVKDRLRVLVPGGPGNVYDEFDLVPAALRDRLGGVRVTITNFHRLKPQTAKPSSVAKLGTQGPGSFAASILGRNASDILVINDEGHHAWRPSAYRGADSRDAEDANLWTSGLDLIHEACTILRCHDFSATPFVPTGKGSTGETLFGWIISDFSLWDAIESGLVKTPRTPRYGDRFYHLYRQEDIGPSLNKGLMPKMVRDAYQLLGADWSRTKKAWSSRSTPPVMITVCNSTRHARLVVDQFRKNSYLLSTDLVKEESLLHIDSEAVRAIGSDEGKREIRDKVSTVGKPGRAGELVCNIVSVDMLTEGWDARTVTHIMGLRAFRSQLLCEQVVGRGLRRTSYDTNRCGRFDPEYVCILGVPFAGIPSESDESGPPPPPPPVEICPDKPEHLVAWPVATDIRDVVTVRAVMDWSRVEPPQLDQAQTPRVDVGPVVDGWVAAEDRTILSQNRSQTVMYGILQDVMGNVRGLKEPSWGEYSPYNESPQQMAVDVLGMVKEYVARCVGTGPGEGLAAMLSEYRDAIARDIFSRLASTDPGSEPRADIGGTGSTAIPCRFTTKKRLFKPKKTHLNIMTADSDLEIEIGRALDADWRVTSWAKSDMAGFAIPYVHPDGAGRSYRPDFVAHLAAGVSLVLEGKGREDEVDRAKGGALRRWVRAVNLDGGYGVWDSAVIYGDRDVVSRLDGIIRSAEGMEHAMACRGCGAGAATPKDAAELLGTEKRRGILGYRAFCRACRNHPAPRV